MYKYAIEIFYSEEDEGYIAVAPELAGCSAFGETEEAALKELMTAMELWLETAKKEGREIPQPVGRGLLRAIVDEKSPFAIHTHKGLAYNRAYLASRLWGFTQMLRTSQILGDVRRNDPLTKRFL